MSHIILTTLAQLGGNRFIAMTGAKNILKSGERTLRFSLPRGFAKNGANMVAIVLEPNDTYTVRFLRAHGLKCTTVSEHEGVYADMLRDVFTGETGLRCTL